MDDHNRFTERPRLTPSDAATTASAPSITSISVASENTPEVAKPVEADTTRGGELETPAIVGIFVGVLAAVCIAVAAMVIFHIRKKRSRLSAVPHSALNTAMVCSEDGTLQQSRKDDLEHKSVNNVSLSRQEQTTGFNYSGIETGGSARSHYGHHIIHGNNGKSRPDDVREAPLTSRSD